MKPEYFHHPDFCPTVARRRLALELLEMVAIASEVLATRGHALTYNQSYPSRAAYHSAMNRLRKDGLVVRQRRGDGQTVLKITKQGLKSSPDVFRPERWWKQKWNGIWYVLVYDVPETQRSYRSTLRRFLKQKRMGCLQGSVWVTPTDIRPAYSDLVEVAGVSDYAFLFASKTVLGQSPEDVVRGAWDLNSLHTVQDWFCRTCAKALRATRQLALDSAALTSMAAEEMAAYERAMAHDPLLPRRLYPADYRGFEAYEAHKEFLREVARRL